MKPPEQPPLQVVLLDVDGTLVDSNAAHAQAWHQALEEHGISAPFDAVRTMIGKGGDKILTELAGIEPESPGARRIGQRRKQIFQLRHLGRLRPLPGARRLVQRIRDAGLRVVAASSASPDDLESLLAVASVRDLVEFATSAADAEHSKPDPDIIQAALRRSGCRPQDAVLIGDTPYDVEAGRRAGVPVLALRCGGWDDAELHSAHAIYDDCEDLLRQYDRSILARQHDSEQPG